MASNTGCIVCGTLSQILFEQNEIQATRLARCRAFPAATPMRKKNLVVQISR